MGRLLYLKREMDCSASFDFIAICDKGNYTTICNTYIADFGAIRARSLRRARVLIRARRWDNFQKPILFGFFPSLRRLH